MAPRVDYERIEPDWRAGIKSPQQMAEEYKEATGHKVSRQAIIKHFKKASIDRDLSIKIRAKAKAKVTLESLQKSCTTKDTATERDIIEANAEGMAQVQLTQRRDVKRSRSLVMDLWGEIEAAGKKMELPQRIDGAKKLTDSLKTLILLERQAYNITDSDSGDSIPQTIKDIISEIDGTGKGLPSDG